MITHSSWVHANTADNATATATKAAPSGGISHYITSISGGYSATKSGKTLILKEGSTEVARWYVYDEKTIDFSKPLKLSPGVVANLVLEASGTASNNGTATMTGYTK